MQTQFKTVNYELLLNNSYNIWDGYEWTNNCILTNIENCFGYYTYEFSKDNGDKFYIDSDFLYMFNNDMYRKEKKYLFINN